MTPQAWFAVGLSVAFGLVALFVWRWQNRAARARIGPNCRCIVDYDQERDDWSTDPAIPQGVMRNPTRPPPRGTDG